jgi:hypothetical protein
MILGTLEKEALIDGSAGFVDLLCKTLQSSSKTTIASGISNKVGGVISLSSRLVKRATSISWPLALDGIQEDGRNKYHLLISLLSWEETP